MVGRAKGELRSAVLRILWSSEEPLTSRGIQARFDPESVPALTTILTVLERLRATGHVHKQPSPSGEFVFSVSGEAFQSAADVMLSALLNSSDTHAALLRFAGDLDDSHVALLRQALDSRDSGRKQR
jgi:predicted transcriptional regulator